MDKTHGSLNDGTRHGLPKRAELAPQASRWAALDVGRDENNCLGWLKWKSTEVEGEL